MSQLQESSPDSSSGEHAPLFLPLDDASGSLPGTPHRTTLWRWALRGLKRGQRFVRLRTVSVGARRFTTAEWIRQFVEECSVGPKSEGQL